MGRKEVLMRTEKVVNLGWAMARIHKEGGLLTIVTPNDQIGDDYVAPQSIMIQGTPYLEALRDLLNEMFPVEKP
jgi:hypothetical protein